jgi:MoaA/NifB/PqqE/SkfB family radical SAM enzyme
MALDLKNAGLFSVSISLDHWKEAEHDQIRRYKGAFRTAMNAIDIFRSIGGVHVGVSAVLSKEMLKQTLVEEYLDFLQSLGIHEVWLSETKPSVAAYWKKDMIISQEEQSMLFQLQDRYNKTGRMTVNYLGHFEDARHFGCSAGHKMVYVDAFGEVSPCVFIPMTFGNVKEQSVKDIYKSMRELFPTEDTCFINKNYEIVQKSMNMHVPIRKEDSKNVMEKIKFGPLAKYFQLQYR